MSKKIYIKEKQLSVLTEAYYPEWFKESSEDIITLYHGTTLESLDAILDSGEINAYSGPQRGETRGINWFSVKPSLNFYKGALFSIDVPRSYFEEMKFHFMNNSEVTSDMRSVPIHNLNFQILRIGDGYSLDVIKRLLNKYNGDLFEVYNRIVENDIFFEEYYVSISDIIFIHLFKQLGFDDSVLREEWGLIPESFIEKDEFTIGDEGDGNMGYIHVNEASKIMCQLDENIQKEISASDVDLSSLKPQSSLEPHIWDSETTINSKVRLMLLDIADDFYATLNFKWTKPIDVVLTGSICNYNWSDQSDIDLHLILDFSEISDDVELLRDYFNMKKNEWNNEHNELNIYNHAVEVYIEDLNDNTESEGIYSLNTNEWLKQPKNSLKYDISRREDKIQKVVADIVTKIEDIELEVENTDDSYILRKLEHKISRLLKNLSKIRKNGLNSPQGESSLGNLVYKMIRRMEYLDKLWKMKIKIYDILHSL